MEKYVELKGENGILRGMMHIPDDGQDKYPMVVMFHGFCDDRNEINFVHTELSRRLCKEGIASVRFDFYGSGESDGEFREVTVSKEVNDGIAIIDYVRSLDFVNNDRVAIHGLSLGGCVASMVAGIKQEEICALSLWCPAPDLIYNLQSSKTLCRQDVSDIEELGYADVEGLYFSVDFYRDALTLDPYKVASNYKGPVNLVHGDKDITASVNCSYEYKKIFKERANLLIVKGAEHRFLSFEYRAARMNSAMEFLVSHLRKD